MNAFQWQQRFKYRYHNDPEYRKHILEYQKKYRKARKGKVSTPVKGITAEEWVPTPGALEMLNRLSGD